MLYASHTCMYITTFLKKWPRSAPGGAQRRQCKKIGRRRLCSPRRSDFVSLVPVYL